MLDPDARSMYTEAITPPPGYLFDYAAATTYTLDPETLLTMPVHLALAEKPSGEKPDPIKIIESLRRISGRFIIYADQTGIKIPSRGNTLFGLLESMVFPVRAPGGGVFHPKIWVIRFKQPDIQSPPLIRLLVLSRNITFDRSWDISLQLEGKPGDRNISTNRPLANFFRYLPSRSTRPVEGECLDDMNKLIDELGKTKWEAPEGFEKIYFHILGTGGSRWQPPRSDRMAVISPFITDETVLWLRKQTKSLSAVISRPEALNRLKPETLKAADKWLILEEAAETEDGEEPDLQDNSGLHAKVYLTEKGSRTNLYIGSANATGPALLRGGNIEILAGLMGKTRRAGGIDTLLGEDGLLSFLSEYHPPEEAEPPDAEDERAEKILREAKISLSNAGLRVICSKEDDSWNLTLSLEKSLSIDHISNIKAWPITLNEGKYRDVTSLKNSHTAYLGKYSKVSVTGLIAFELTENTRQKSLRLVLNLPVENPPEDRDDAILRMVLKDREGFLRYLLLLMGEYSGNLAEDENVFSGKLKSGFWTENLTGETPILEELVRTFSRDPEKLKDIKTLVSRLSNDKDSKHIIPQSFLEMWQVFEKAMEESKS